MPISPMSIFIVIQLVLAGLIRGSLSSEVPQAKMKCNTVDESPLAEPVLEHGRPTRFCFKVVDIPDEFAKSYIFPAMKAIEHQSCIKFECSEPTSDITVMFVNNTKGKCLYQRPIHSRGEHFISLDTNGVCNSRRTVLHQIMHFLGFHHEHQRFDRDKFVHVVWEKLKDETCKNQYKGHRQPAIVDSHTPYDVFSIMHFDVRACLSIWDVLFPTETMTLKTKNAEHHLRKVGKGHDLSALDQVKLNRLYRCFEDGCDDDIPDGSCKEEFLNHHHKYDPRLGDGFCDACRQKNISGEVRRICPCIKTCGKCRCLHAADADRCQYCQGFC